MLVWFDTEYTTLEIEDALLLQVAALITNEKLCRVLPPEQDVNLFIRIPEEKQVSSWVEEHLPDLVKKCRSPEAVDINDADNALDELLELAIRPAS